jgi:uncharacterized membrane protein HdeD (DUF308 family)
MNYMEQPVEVVEQPVEAEIEGGYETLETPWWAVLVEGIIAILVGLFLLYRPAVTTIFLLQILGIFWLAGGILSVLGAFMFSGNRLWKLLAGILSIIAGVVILTYPIISPFVVLTFFVIFIGVWAMITGAVKLLGAFKGEGWGTGILGIITIILGILLLMNTLAGVLILPWVFGFFLIVGGVGAVIVGLKMRT